MSAFGGMPGDSSTEPDALDPDARIQLDLIHGEQITRCWKVPYGFLVATNLRAIYVWKRNTLLHADGWQTGPTYMFYNMAPPRVVGWRFVELSEDPPLSQSPFRFLVRDPTSVCADLGAARLEGRAEWQRRRSDASRAAVQRRPFQPPPGATVVVHEVVKIRCAYCGALMDEGAALCPRCGAPPR